MKVDRNNLNKQVKSLCVVELLVALYRVVRIVSINDHSGYYIFNPHFFEWPSLRLTLCYLPPGDLKLVRCQMRTISKEVNTVTIETNRERLLMDDSLMSQLHYEKERARLLERDVQSLLAEKEKLLVSKTDLQLKNERLNGHLVTVLRSMTMEQRQHYQQQAGDPANNNTLLYDIDRLSLENR